MISKNAQQYTAHTATVPAGERSVAMSCPYQRNGAPRHICSVVGRLTGVNVRPDWHGTDDEIDHILSNWDREENEPQGSKFARASTAEASRAATEMFEALGIDPSEPEAASLIEDLATGRISITRGNAANMSRMGWVVKKRLERSPDTPAQSDRNAVIQEKTLRYARAMKVNSQVASVFAQMEELGPDMAAFDRGAQKGEQMTFDERSTAMTEVTIQSQEVLDDVRRATNNAEWQKAFDTYRTMRSYRHGLAHAQERWLLREHRRGFLPDEVTSSGSE